MSETVHHPRPVEVEPRRRFVGHGMEAGATGEGILAEIEGVPAQCLEQRMPRSHPFEVVRFRRVAVRREARISDRQLGRCPARFALVLLQAGRRATRLERMRKAAHRLERQGRISCTLLHEPCDGLRHHPPLLRPRPAFDEHVEVELPGRQPFQSGLADAPEVTLVHVLQEPVFEIGVAELAGVVVPKHPFHMGGRQDLAHHVEHRIVIQCVADLLELVHQALQHPYLDGVGGDEIENQAIVVLPVAVDAAHALLEPVRVPGDVVVEQDVAALKVDAFPGRLGGHTSTWMAPSRNCCSA